MHHNNTLVAAVVSPGNKQHSSLVLYPQASISFPSASLSPLIPGICVVLCCATSSFLRKQNQTYSESGKLAIPLRGNGNITELQAPRAPSSPGCRPSDQGRGERRSWPPAQVFSRHLHQLLTRRRRSRSFRLANRQLYLCKFPPPTPGSCRPRRPVSSKVTLAFHATERGTRTKAQSMNGHNETHSAVMC